MKKILTLSLLTLLSISMYAQTRKVILEDFTGTWCGWCPEGTVIIENLLSANPADFIPVASHNGDALEIPEGDTIDTGLDVTGYPNGAVDRYKYTGQAKIPMSRGAWANAFATRKAMPAIVSVSFENAVKTGANSYSATVKVKFTSAPTAGVPIKVNVYLTEDSIAATGAYEQGNYSGNVQGGATPLTNWFHNATLRDALGGTWGFAAAIPGSPVVGTTYSQNVNFTLNANWVPKHMNVIAFVAYDGPAASNQKEILNAEQLALKYWYPTGVNDVERENMQVNVYPNPAAMNGVVKTSFVLKEDAVVTMQVLNALGQVVSKPYSSYEIKGAHTIQWSAVENSSLTPGMYFVQLSTDKGDKQISKLMLK